MRPAFLIGLTLALAASAAMATEVTLRTETGTLAGTLTMPDHPAPGVLIIAGSGPTDRDGNQPGAHNDALRRLAEGLAACGVASLRADKRGVGASHDAAPDEDLIVFDTYTDDAVAWLDWLRARPRISSVSALGHSEGALIATRAAKRTALRRLVLAEGAGRRAGEVLSEQLASRLVASPALLQQARATIAHLEQGEGVEFPPVALGALFRGSVQPYLISWFKLDPAAELASVHVPTLIVQGTTDLQVTVTDAQRLHAARPDAALAIFPGMNHVLRAAPADWGENFVTYQRPDLALMPGLMTRLCAFLGGGP